MYQYSYVILTDKKNKRIGVRYVWLKQNGLKLGL